MSGKADEAHADVELDEEDDGSDVHDAAEDDDGGVDAANDHPAVLTRAEHRPPAEVLAEMDARELTVMETATAALASTGELPPLIGRFLDCTKGNEAASVKRWRATLEWRVRENMNEILREPQPDFDKIKQYYPHFYQGKSKQGHQIYYELPGRVNLKKLHASGVTFESLLRYYLFSAEFLQSMLLPSDTSKTITIFDCTGLAMRKIPRDVKQFMMAANALMSEHFPERAFKVFIINVPMTFSVLWKVAASFIDPATKAKISVLRGKKTVLKALTEHIALDQLPKRYGGTSPFELGGSPEEAKLADLVHALSAK